MPGSWTGVVGEPGLGDHRGARHVQRQRVGPVSGRVAGRAKGARPFEGEAEQVRSIESHESARALAWCPSPFLHDWTQPSACTGAVEVAC